MTNSVYATVQEGVEAHAYGAVLRATRLPARAWVDEYVDWPCSRLMHEATDVLQNALARLAEES